MSHAKTPLIRRTAILGTLLTASLLAPGLAHGPTHAAGTTTLTVALNPEPDTLDPQKTGTAVTSSIAAYFGDTLVALSPKNQIVPDLAKSWTVSKDGLTYAFNLRQDVSFQDGTPLNAAAYVATFKRLLDPATKAAVELGQLPSIAAVTETGKYSFSIKIKAPSAFFLYNLSDSNFQPLSPTALKSEGAGFGRKPVSTGPWQVQSWTTGQQIVLVKNPNYKWGPSFVHHGPANIDKLVFRVLLNAASATAAFQNGEVDQLLLDSASVARIQSAGKYQILKQLNPGVRELELNVTQPPFDDIRVRKALNYAINKDAVVKVAINGLGVPVYGVLSPAMYGYWPGIKSYGYSYNPQKALALLAQAGYTKNSSGQLAKNGKPLSFTLLSNPIPFFKLASLVIQDQLKQIGITVNIETQQFATEIASIHKGTAQADVMGYNYPHPGIFYIWFHSSQQHAGFNDSFYADPKLDALIVKMQSTVDTAARNALVVQLEKTVSDQALWVPLFDEYVYTAFQPRVKGPVLDPRGRVILNDVTVGQ
ncbi:MAG: ABC-type dipeptide transport system, periplasmic component [Chloroflexi bacterium]|nr:ABC-type dipeptide transport system, periplasmic component [Chloroflexota bacterium]